MRKVVSTLVIAMAAPMLSHAAIAQTLPRSTTAATARCSSATASTNQLPVSLIPPGYLHTAGNQIVDAAGEPIRIAAVGALSGNGYSDTEMQKILFAGFNAFRVSYFDASLHTDLKAIDAIVSQATKYGVKVIINHHANEGDGACDSQQVNGLWFDSGPGTNGTDGCGAQGTVTQAKFLQNWVTVAQHYAGNSTVIGFDLDNEPLEKPGGSTWGDGSVTDIRTMYQTVGNAILAVDPDVLIIAEGPIEWSPLYGTDLTHVTAAPVILSTPNQLVYSAHEYPSTIGAEPFDSGPRMIADMNTSWGYLETQNIAPVWVGEIGASLDGTADSAGSGLADELAWAATMAAYLNGQDGSHGGPTFTGAQQAISTDWWAWGSEGIPDGTLDANGNLRQGQWNVYTQFKQSPVCAAYATRPRADQPAGLHAVP